MTQKQKSQNLVSDQASNGNGQADQPTTQKIEFDVWVKVYGVREYTEEGDTFNLAMVAEGPIAEGGNLIRTTTYAAARAMNTVNMIQFYKVPGDSENPLEDDRREMVAELTPDDQNWTVVFKDGKTHDGKTTVERAGARKSSKKWKEVDLTDGARDLGPDHYSVAAATLKEIGLVSGAVKSSRTTSKLKAQLAEETAKREALERQVSELLEMIKAKEAISK